MRIVQVANFVAPHSGGIRTVLRHLADGYARAGHEVIQIIPGSREQTVDRPWGWQVTLPGIPVPGTGYHLLPPQWVMTALEELRPDRLEVHDRSTLRSLGRWAARRDIPAMVVAHERLDRVLRQWLPGPVPIGRAADRSNLALATSFDTVLCTTGWAAEEFRRLQVANLTVVPLGVDSTQFHPRAYDPDLRAQLAPDGAPLLVLASRLSKEKLPMLAIDTVAELTRRGIHVRLAVAGDGPQRPRLRAHAADLPVEFLGFLDGPARVSALLATADVVLAPGPVETFGLAALEALAAGTPVVANSASALPEVLGRAGLVAPGTAAAFADAVSELLDQPREERAGRARHRAELFDWTTTVRGFLTVHSRSEQKQGLAA